MPKRPLPFKLLPVTKSPDPGIVRIKTEQNVFGLLKTLVVVLLIALQLRAPGRPGRPSRRSCFFAMAASLLPCYLLGAAWFALYTGRTLAAAAAAACLPFLPFDLLKALLAAHLSSRSPAR